MDNKTPIIKVIGSNSSGNSYILDCLGEYLLIELGVKWDNILNGLNYKTGDVVGCLVSHRHSDHSKSISKALYRRLSVYSCVDVSERFNGVFPLKPNKKYKIGKFEIQCIPVPHGDCPCYGFIIDNPDMGRMLFITDASDFPYKVKGVNHLFIEANYMEDIILDNACNNKWNSSASNTHMGIEKSAEVIKRHYSENLHTVCLIHLSDGNSDANKFKDIVFEEVGIRPFIAESGLEIELKKEEF